MVDVSTYAFDDEMDASVVVEDVDFGEDFLL